LYLTLYDDDDDNDNNDDDDDNNNNNNITGLSTPSFQYRGEI